MRYCTDSCSADMKVSFVEKWPMMDPNEMAFLLVVYLLFVLKVGPAVMDGRNPVRIKSFLLFYNAFKVINSALLAYKFLSYIFDKGLFPRKCDHNEVTLYVIATLYWKYMATKILDLCDTIFFVIRKKYNQISFLHVYHHVFTVAISWFSLKYDPSDHWLFMAFMNCSIHTAMYTYYGMSALGPQFAKYLWWKKYLTMMQLIQFVLVIAHVMIQTYTSECPMNASTYYVGLLNLAFFICLFSNFYKKRYLTHNKTKLRYLGLGCANDLAD